MDSKDRLSPALPSEINPYAAPAPIEAEPVKPVVMSGDEPSPEVFDELQRVANFRHVQKTLKASGTGSIVFGLIAIVVGVMAMQHNPVNAILLGIGILLAVEGTWLVIAPAPAGIIVDGISLMLVGVWNIWVTINNMAAGQHTSTWGVIGVFQIIWGFQSFSRYSRFSKMPRETPSPATIQRIDEIVKDIAKTKPAVDPEIIDFKMQAFFGGVQPWKARLRGNHAVFVGPGGKDVIFARTREVDIRSAGKKALSKTLKATFRITDRNFKGIISPESFARYQTWRQATSGAPIPVIPSSPA